MSSGQLYKPFLSDSEYESDTDSDVVTDGYTSEESLIDIPGKNPPVETAVPALIKDPGTILMTDSVGTKFETAESRNTFLLTINSRDRDTRVYPLPTYFTLRLPRVLKNVKQINISQMNLLNSFFNFSVEKGNTFMYVLESGRTILSNGVDISNSVRINIRNGTYTADSLVNELTEAMNTTPLFTGITFADFAAAFRNTGNYSLMFNTPGQYSYNSLTQSNVPFATLASVVARYFQIVQTVGTISYSDQQIRVAYYYPVVKEMIIAQPEPLPFSVGNMTVPPGFNSWYEYLNFGFAGLDDPYVSTIVNIPSNIPLFDAFRAKNTFNQFLVNKYTLSYNAQQGRLKISAPSLSDSIVTDLNIAYSNFLGSEVIKNGFTNTAQFNSNYNSIQNSNGALIEFYNYLQLQFAKYFGVTYGKYSDKFYANLSNEIQLYNTCNNFGWYLTPQATQLNISSNPPTTQVPLFWSNISFRSTVGETFVYDYAPANTLANSTLMFSNAGEATFGYSDISFSMVPTTYARTLFNTRCRQNISIMTIPRYINERSPGTQEYYNLNSTITPFLFDYDPADPGGSTFYYRCDVSGNVGLNMFTVTQNMFNSADYMRALDEWLNYTTPQYLAGKFILPGDPAYGTRPNLGDVNMTSFRPYVFFQMDADKYLVEPAAHFNVSFYVETQDGTNFPIPIAITWYKDRAGFMADVQKDLDDQLSGENPRHYFQRQVYTTDISSAVMVVGVNNLQTTYFHVNFISTDNLPANLPLRIFCVLTDTYGVYRLSTFQDNIGMPYQNLPPLADQFTPDSAIYNSPLTSIYVSSITQICYDVSSISNNLLDYSIQAPNNPTFHYDPESIRDFENGTSNGLRYLFLQNTNGTGGPDPSISSPQTWSLYFQAGSANTIRDTYNNVSNVYLGGGQTPAQRLTDNLAVISGWWNTTTPTRELYIPPAPAAAFNTTTTTFKTCVNTGFSLNTDASTLTAVGDTSGFAGVSFFLPPNEIVKMDTFLMKFAYTQPSMDSNGTMYNRFRFPGNATSNGNVYNNQVTGTAVVESESNDWDDWYLYNRRNIKVGIFPTADISGASVAAINLSNALVSMTLTTVTQVNNYTDATGSVRTREPDWGTYYTYRFEPSSAVRWIVSSVSYVAGTEATTVYYPSTLIGPDFAPTYVAGNTSNGDYFLTPTNLVNYSYLPRSYGIAASVGNAITNSSFYTSSFTADIPNSFTAVPFVYNPATSNYSVGSFYGITFTTQPTVPSTSLIGAANYFGAPGPFTWKNNGGIFTLSQPQSAGQSVPIYPTAKVSFAQLDQQYNPATDLSSFGGYAGLSGELQDTMLFFYSSATAAQADIFTADVNPANSKWKWGQESPSNYTAWDDQAGYNFLSYLYNLSIRPNPNLYAAQVRAYDPIPGFNTGLRFIGKNYTDFGNPTFQEMGNEISSLGKYSPISDASGNIFLYNTPAYLSTLSTNNVYRETAFISHEYADSLIRFDRAFSTTQTFGLKLGYGGVTFTTSSFIQAITAYGSFRSTTLGTLALYTNILSTSSGYLNDYVLERYGDILPSTIISRNRITDPLPFQFLFASKTPEPYKSLPDEWGLGWNLGFYKVDTVPRTTITSDTFIRIVQDYIYLRLNPELNVNTLAVSGKENLSETRESQAQDTKYFSKILLAGFAGYSRAAVQLPKLFNPVLGKYDTVVCELVDKFGIRLSNTDCDYDFVLECTEIDQRPKDTASLVLPQSANQGAIVERQAGFKQTAAKRK